MTIVLIQILHTKKKNNEINTIIDQCTKYTYYNQKFIFASQVSPLILKRQLKSMTL